MLEPRYIDAGTTSKIHKNTYAQRRSCAGPTSSIVGQHWTSVCRDVYRNVWLYNLDYHTVVGVRTPLFSRSAIHSIATCCPI